MKRAIRVLALTLIYVMFCCSFATTAYAKDLEVCRLCGGNGKYHCQWCNNTGEVTCGGCGGAGGSKCSGSCTDGYLICSSCNGDGKMRNGDGVILDDGVCGNCNGSGKVHCITCAPSSKPGWNFCTGCNGLGKQVCQACGPAREIGYKCPKCTGTGYCLVANPMPPEEDNDGIKNVPIKGDHIIIDEAARYIIYGDDLGTVYPLPDNGSNGNDNTGDIGETDNSADKDNGNDDNSENDANQEGKYIVWFGEGSWKIGDVIVTADKTNIQYLNENDTITLTNFDADTMEVRVEAEDGFRTTLLVNNGKTSISANTNNGPIAIDIAFSVVAKESTSGDEEGSVEDSIIIPPDRTQDFEISSTESTDAKQPASATVVVGKMTEKEKERYAGLTDEELNRKLVNVQGILNTVRAGEFTDNTKELINEVAKINGIDNLEDGKIFPLSFEGHEYLGFPIAVTVQLEKGMLESDTALFVYHILEDKSIESLGKAEYTTYDDGSVESITFYTTGFSSFFTSTTEISKLDSVSTTEISKLESVPTTEISKQELDKDNYLWIWIVVAVVVVGGVIVCIALVKKKYNRI